MKTYDYPSGDAISPFDAESDWQYFIYARGFSYLAADPSVFSDHTEILKAIPMGYKVLLTIERRYLIQNGDLHHKKVFPVQPDELLQKIFRILDTRYVVCHDFDDQLLRHYGCENCVVFNREDEAMNQAHLLARLNPNITVIMGKLVNLENWH